MMSKALKLNTVRSVMLVCAMGFGATWVEQARADIRTQAIVTVYSNGKVMATYEAVDRGRMEDECYVFHVRRGVRDVEVRVCGTFTVEQVR